MTVTRVGTQRPAAPPAVASPAARGRRVVDGHWPFLAILLVGLVVRLVAAVAYWPALMFYGDSYAYLRAAGAATPPIDRPFGYPALLRALSWMPSLASVPLVQHLLGLGIGVAIYAVLVRRGAPRWVATACSAPILLDGYQIAIEQQVMSETLFGALLLAGVVLALRARTARGGALAGLVLAAAAVTRTAGVVVVVLTVGYLLLRRRGWRCALAAAATAALALGSYGGWFAAAHGEWALQGQSGHFLYGRVAPFADCSGLSLDAAERSLCPTQPVGERRGPNWFDWSPDTPYAALGASANNVSGQFARSVILAQPLDYLHAVARDTARYFAPGRSTPPTEESNEVWRFPSAAVSPGSEHVVAQYDISGHYTGSHFSPDAAAFLRDYQRFLYFYGPLLAVFALIGVFGGTWRCRGRPPIGCDALYVALAGLALLVVPSATAMFSYRYALPAGVLLPLAAGLVATRGDPAAAATAAAPAYRRRPVAVTVAGCLAMGAVVAGCLAPLAPYGIFDAWSLRHRAEFGRLGPMVAPACRVGGSVVQPFLHGALADDGVRVHEVSGGDPCRQAAATSSSS